MPVVSIAKITPGETIVAKYVLRRAEPVEAIQFDPDGVHSVAMPRGVHRTGGIGSGYQFDGDDGWQAIRAGDWIVTEYGNTRVMRPAEFAEMYEPYTARHGTDVPCGRDDMATKQR